MSRAGYQVFRLHRLDASHGSTLENGCRFVECLHPGLLGDVDATYITIPPGERTVPHFHRRSRCFVFVVDGRVIAHVGRRRQRLTMNDFILILPRTTHSFEALDDPVTLFSLHSPAIGAGTPDGDIEFCGDGRKK